MNSRLIHLCIVLLFLFEGCSCRKATQSPTVTNPKVESSSTILRTKQPITLAEAQALLKVPFPPTAKNVQFYQLKDFPIVARYIRFEAPAADCVATANEMLTNFNASNSVTTVPPMSGELHPEWSRGGTAGVPTWFDPEKITQGQCGGMIGSHTPVIWVDTDKGIFYYQYND